MLILALSPSFIAFADATPSFGPQTYQVHKYYYFGDAEFAKGNRQGISIAVDASSVSYQSVKATVTMDYNIINDRQITKFIILANGVNVDEFEPYFDTAESPPVYKEYYYLDINVSDQYIGSDVFFQVVALHQDNMFTPSSNVFVVGWSQETPTVRLKRLPVTDPDTHGLINETNGLIGVTNNLIRVSNDWLNKIWLKLDEMKMELLAKLEQIDKDIKRIYEVTPQTQAKFDAAIANIEMKMPTKQMEEKVQELQDMMNESKDLIEGTEQKLTFGEFDWMGTVHTALLDFSQLVDVLEKMRRILQIALWCEFFYFVVLVLRPRLVV
jgi:hypothetical protein